MTSATPTTRTNQLKRWLPLAILVTIAGALYVSGAHKFLSLEYIAVNKAVLEDNVKGNLLLGGLLFMGAYIVVVALSLPGALIMTLLGGLLFGLWIGTALSVVAATIGATVFFLIASSSLGEALRSRGGVAVAKMREGLNANAASYLLFLRLVPAFPFALVNLAAAVVGTPLGTFVWTTMLIGILPGSFAFTLAATSLGGVLDQQLLLFEACKTSGRQDCRIQLDLSSLISGKLLLAFASLGLVALIPIVAKRFYRHAASPAAPE